MGIYKRYSDFIDKVEVEVIRLFKKLKTKPKKKSPQDYIEYANREFHLTKSQAQNMMELLGLDDHTPNSIEDRILEERDIYHGENGIYPSQITMSFDDFIDFSKRRFYIVDQKERTLSMFGMEVDTIFDLKRGEFVFNDPERGKQWIKKYKR